jgi:hypothetical protein
MISRKPSKASSESGHRYMEANTKNQYGCRRRHCSPRKQTICHGVYKAELDEAMKRKRTYEDNMFKAYALLWERCAKTKQDKIASRSDYDSVVYNNPIALLRAIKEHSLNYQDTRYEMSIISDAFRSLCTSKQKDGESLQDYTRRFKTRRFWNPIWEDR